MVINLGELLREDLEDVSHPSKFEVDEEFDILILRIPEIEKGVVKAVSYPFLIKGETCFTFDREKSKLEEIGNLKDIHHFLDVKMDALLKEMASYHYEIDLLEDSLYEKNAGYGNMFMQKWLTYKKEISVIHSLMFQITLAFEMFLRKYRVKNLSTFYDDEYQDLYEHMKRIRNLAKFALEKLDNLYDFYRAKIDERMNKNMYWLTVVSVIFLPLTLITGFFGMNTGGLPWAQDPIGTWKVVIFSIILELLLLIPFIVNSMKKIKRFKR